MATPSDRANRRIKSRPRTERQQEVTILRISESRLSSDIKNDVKIAFSEASMIVVSPFVSSMQKMR
jgi:hypothetical protein